MKPGIEWRDVAMIRNFAVDSASSRGNAMKKLARKLVLAFEHAMFAASGLGYRFADRLERYRWPWRIAMTLSSIPDAASLTAHALYCPCAEFWSIGKVWRSAFRWIA